MTTRKRRIPDLDELFEAADGHAAAAGDPASGRGADDHVEDRDVRPPARN